MIYDFHLQGGYVFIFFFEIEKELRKNNHKEMQYLQILLTFVIWDCKRLQFNEKIKDSFFYGH